MPYKIKIIKDMQIIEKEIQYLQELIDILEEYKNKQIEVEVHKLERKIK